MGWDMARKDELADLLWAACDMPPLSEFLDEHRPYFTADGLATWLGEGHAVGLHSATHPDCSRLDADGVRVEILDPARRLCTDLGQASVAFSYPSGDAAVLRSRGCSPRQGSSTAPSASGGARPVGPIRCASSAHRSSTTCISRFMARRSSVPPVRPERAARRAPMLSRGMTGYLGMDLPRFLALVRARRWLILGIVVAATVLALVWSLYPAESVRRRCGSPVRTHDERGLDHHRGRHRHRRRARADGGHEPRARLPGLRCGERQAAGSAVR